MGTSSPDSGPQNKDPLIPDWANDDLQNPPPEPEPNRYQGFRTNFGRFVKSGDTQQRNRALKSYASVSTGGSAVGPQRLSKVYHSGGQLAELLNNVANGLQQANFDLADFQDQPIEKFAQAVAELVSEQNPDEDLIDAAVQEAIIEVLGDDSLDPNSITEDVIIHILVEFLSRAILLQVTKDAGDSWQKTDNPKVIIQRENELLDLIKVIVDSKLTDLTQATQISQAINLDVSRLMKACAVEVWSTWENYND